MNLRFVLFFILNYILLILNSNSLILIFDSYPIIPLFLKLYNLSHVKSNSLFTNHLKFFHVIHYFLFYIFLNPLFI